MAANALHYWGYTNSRGETYLSQPPSPPSERKKSTLNLLPSHEILFLSFEKENIYDSVKSGKDITYLPSALSDIKEKQKEFCAWVNENHSSLKLSIEELDVTKIVNSIWEKTKKFCATQPNSTSEDEKRRQIEAEGSIRQFPGKVAFTTRQAVVLLNTINEIERPSVIPQRPNANSFVSETGTCQAVILGDAFG